MAEAGGAVTTRGFGVEELPANTELALNDAEMACVPAASDAVLKVAVPSAWRATVPRGAAPSKNVAPPNGVPDPDETDAVMVTTVPAGMEAFDKEAEVAVGTLVTVTVTGAEVLGGKISPELENPW